MQAFVCIFNGEGKMPKSREVSNYYLKVMLHFKSNIFQHFRPNTCEQAS